MHNVTLKPGGRRFTAAPGERLLDAALAAGIGLAYGCRNGACRSCAATVLAGEVHYPDGDPQALDAGEVAAGRVLLCAAEAATDLALEVEEPDPDGLIQVRTLPCRVVVKETLAHDVVRLELALPAGERLIFRAGQYVDILLRDGRRRAFSLASPPGRGDRLELHIRHVPGGSFSAHAFERLKPRDLLRLEGPLGSFWLRTDPPRPAILVAGGTGFAPVKSMLEDAFARFPDLPMHLYWGVRARRDLYLHEQVAQWQRQHPRLHYVPVLSDPLPEDGWQGRTGFVHQAVLEDFPDLSGHNLYLSGPPVMVNAGRRQFPARGADPSHMYSDAFDYAYETGHDDVG